MKEIKSDKQLIYQSQIPIQLFIQPQSWAFYPAHYRDHNFIYSNQGKTTPVNPECAMSLLYIKGLKCVYESKLRMNFDWIQAIVFFLNELPEPLICVWPYKAGTADATANCAACETEKSSLPDVCHQYCISHSTKQNLDDS